MLVHSIRLHQVHVRKYYLLFRSLFYRFIFYLVGSVQNYHDQLLSFCSQYLNSITNSLLRMALALRFYSPAVQMMRKMAHDTGMTRQCSTFVDIHGVYTCNVDDIDNLIQSASER